MERCIKACRNCVKEMGPEHPCSLCCSDCYNICEYTLDSDLNNNQLDIQLLDLCINACNFCIVECQKHMEHHKTCAECVIACNRCILECNQFKLNIIENMDNKL
jgi:hypothetical protein